jgi:hypothetical protein
MFANVVGDVTAPDETNPVFAEGSTNVGDRLTGWSSGVVWRRTLMTTECVTGSGVSHRNTTRGTA